MTRRRPNGNTYEAAHAKLARESIEIIPLRKLAVENKEADALRPPPAKAAEQAYIDTANKLYEGLDKTLNSYQNRQQMYSSCIAQLWNTSSMAVPAMSWAGRPCY